MTDDRQIKVQLTFTVYPNTNGLEVADWISRIIKQEFKHFDDNRLMNIKSFDGAETLSNE